MYAPDPIIEAEREFLCKFAELGLSVARVVHRRLVDTNDDRMTVDLAGAFNRSARTARLCLILAAKLERDRRKAPLAEARAAAEPTLPDPAERAAQPENDPADDEIEPPELLADAEPEPLEAEDALDRLDELEDLEGDPAVLAEQACDELASLAADFGVPVPTPLRRRARRETAPPAARPYEPATPPEIPGRSFAHTPSARRPPRQSSA